jgi:hypothetical protein
MNVFPSHVARRFSSQGFGAAARWTGRMTLLLSVPFVALATVVALAADPLARLMYGAGTSPPHLLAVVAIGALIYVINFARTPLDFLILVAGGGRPIFIRALWLMAFIWTCGIALIYRWGVLGAMIAETIAAVLALSIALGVFLRLRAAAQRALNPASSATRTLDALAVA